MKLRVNILKARLFYLVCLTLLATAAFAAVKPHALFSDNAVLQQGISVPIWGTANNGEKVTVKFEGQTAATTAKGGRWMVRLKPLRAGGPSSMTISGENTIELKNILVGEVWICSGQSNMQFGLKSATNGEAAIAASADPMIRLFTVPRDPRYVPQADVVGAWEECGPDTVPNFTAVGYFFGRDLRKALNVPVGLINDSYGGTRAEAWTACRALEEPCKKPDDPEAKANPNDAGALYNGMIAPIIPYALRGAIWYQGESNAGGAFKYRTHFPAMIRNWREDWKQGDFPFLFVQLAPFQKIVPEPQESAWAELREAQLLTTVNCPNTGMAVITDIGDPADIHPKQKEPVGGRLALAARAIAYGEKIVYKGPTYDALLRVFIGGSIKVWGDRAIVSFDSDSLDGGLIAKGGEMTGWAIAGEDRKFYNARAVIRDDKATVIVSSPDVPRPVAVRYGWADCPVVNLFNAQGLPASPFRTDDFPMVTAPKEQTSTK